MAFACETIHIFNRTKEHPVKTLIIKQMGKFRTDKVTFSKQECRTTYDITKNKSSMYQYVYLLV